MTARRLRREEFTVGWVCALPVELAAAQEILDEVHEQLQHNPNDTHIYTLGRIGEHNVVVACLPDEQTGTTSAAALAMQIKSAFKSTHFGLMVGIGGGVPSDEAYIRLGDAVVSRPHKIHCRVMQYDFGKAILSGLEWTSFLNTPPKILLNGLSNLQANHVRGKSRLLEYGSKFDSLPAFARKDAGPDVLFEARYNHEGGATYGACSKEKVVARPSRREEIVVHYVTITSGNQVMSHAAERDRVSAELRGFLCSETEAAVLMNSFPYLVVRGIYDYADSHKNKKWQAIAAGTAADQGRWTETEKMNVQAVGVCGLSDLVMEDALRPSKVETQRLLVNSLHTWESYKHTADSKEELPFDSINLLAILSHVPAFLGVNLREHPLQHYLEQIEYETSGELWVTGKSTWHTTIGNCNLPKKVLQRLAKTASPQIYISKKISPHSTPISVYYTAYS